jgi:hypothetical protein
MKIELQVQLGVYIRKYPPPGGGGGISADGISGKNIKTERRKRRNTQDERKIEVKREK